MFEIRSAVTVLGLIQLTSDLLLSINVFPIGQLTGHPSSILRPIQSTSDLLQLIKCLRIGQVIGHRSALLGLHNWHWTCCYQSRYFVLAGLQVIGHLYWGPIQLISDLLLSIKLFRIGQVTGHRSALLGANTADIGPIANIQLISYWPSYGSPVSFIGINIYSWHRTYCYQLRYFVLAKLHVIGHLYWDQYSWSRTYCY